MSFALVLHGHIPFCRKSGTWPAGEEWLHEAIIESYLPVLRALNNLINASIPVALNIEFTPVLLEQLADVYMQDKFLAYLESLIEKARVDKYRFQGHGSREQVAEYLIKEYEFFHDFYVNKIHKDVIGAYRRLQDQGTIEIFTCAATHGFLPLMAQDSAIWSQIKLGVDTYDKYFNRKPDGIWLPECAFRPMIGDRAGIDYWVKKAGIKYFLVNYTALGDAMLTNKNPEHVDYITTFEPYCLAGTSVNVLSRNFDTSERVWSAKVGYPGHAAYMEFHVKDPISGLRYLSVTGKDCPKATYDPNLAKSQAKADAQDFAGILATQLSGYKEMNQREGIVVSPYDFELFGHWWHEGPEWIQQVFTLLENSDDIHPVKLNDFLEPKEGHLSEIVLKETSWGEGGDFRVWKNPQHGWTWPLINDCVKQFEIVLQQIGTPENEIQHRVLKQLARELLLLEGSDWPFLLYTAQAKEYANQRFHWHHQRFNTLLWAAKDFNDQARLNHHFLEEIESIDNLFPDIDVNFFRNADT